MEEGAEITPRKAEPAIQRGARLPGRRMRRTSLLLSSEHVAPLLLGKLLVSLPRAGGDALIGRIVEVEAYLGPHHATPDPAAHSHRGPTPRRCCQFFSSTIVAPAPPSFCGA